MPKITITDKMIEAGIEAYAQYSFYDPGEWVVAAIYEAMRDEDESNGPRLEPRPAIPREGSEPSQDVSADGCI